MKAGFAIGSLLGAVACASFQGPRVNQPPEPVVTRFGCGARCTDSVEVRYLGVSGFAIRYRTSTLLTGPSFTHPGVLSSAL